MNLGLTSSDRLDASAPFMGPVPTYYGSGVIDVYCCVSVSHGCGVLKRCMASTLPGSNHSSQKKTWECVFRVKAI